MSFLLFNRVKRVRKGRLGLIFGDYFKMNEFDYFAIMSDVDSVWMVHCLVLHDIGF